MINKNINVSSILNHGNDRYCYQWILKRETWVYIAIIINLWCITGSCISGYTVLRALKSVNSVDKSEGASTIIAAADAAAWTT